MTDTPRREVSVLQTEARARGGAPVRSLAGRSAHLYPLSLQVAGLDSLDAAAAAILTAIAGWLPVAAAYAYWQTPDGRRYRLRGTLAEARGTSGEDTERALPRVLSAEDVPRQLTLSGNRRETWLWLPFPPGDLALYVLLRQGTRLSGRTRLRLSASLQAHAGLVAAVARWLQTKETAERLSRTAEAARVALETGTQLDAALLLLLRIGGRIVDARTSFALVDSPDGRLRLSDTEEGLAWAERVLSGQGFADLLVVRPDPDLVPLAERSEPGRVAVARVPILADGQVLGCFYYLLAHSDPLTSFAAAGLRTLAGRAAQVLGGHHYLREAARTYVDTLGAMAAAMDALSPHSIGHSERTARYAARIAEELALPPRQVEAVRLAARLHDVGMIGVDARLVLKPDQFTVDEYEHMKAHAELGRQLLQSLPDGPEIGSMVAAHHERWDGAGYPLGLVGEEIPQGARIIAVADYFEAKTTGRSYRPPLPFDVAVEALRKAAGTALDPQAVEALVRSLERVRSEAPADLPVLPCWQLKALPEHVCAGCPNRRPDPVRCWESPENLCTRHGDDCRTCVVYTEAIARGLPR